MQSPHALGGEPGSVPRQVLSSSVGSVWNVSMCPDCALSPRPGGLHSDKAARPAMPSQPGSRPRGRAPRWLWGQELSSRHRPEPPAGQCPRDTESSVCCRGSHVEAAPRQPLGDRGRPQVPSHAPAGAAGCPSTGVRPVIRPCLPGTSLACPLVLRGPWSLCAGHCSRTRPAPGPGTAAHKFRRWRLREGHSPLAPAPSPPPLRHTHCPLRLCPCSNVY